MARIDLHNFFQFYDERNPNRVKAVQWLEDSKYPEYNDAYKRAMVLAEQKGTKEIRHKTLILDVEQ